MAHIQYADSWVEVTNHLSQLLSSPCHVLLKLRLQLEKSLGGVRPVLKGTVEEVKKGYDDLIAMLLPQMPKPSDAVSAKDGEVDGVKYRVYNPVEASKGGPLPVGVYTHGGGMMVGDLNGEDPSKKSLGVGGVVF